MTVERYEGLEATADNLMRLLGADGAHKLAEAFGGRRLYVPKHPGPHHPISVAIGQAGAEQLAAAFHGVDIDVPMLPSKQAEIRRLAALGWSRARIAHEVHCTERWVYKTLGETEKRPDPQPRLFG